MISGAARQVEHRLGREAKESEVAAELNLSLKDYHEMLQDSACSHLYGFDDLGVTDDVLYVVEGMSSEPHANVLRSDMLRRLSEVIDGLPHKERLVLSLYYEQDLNLKEIGDVLEVSESRISQILSQATLRVKSRIVE
jgi:RNA polymerase sigma factor for flagellar operon FliA